MRAVLFAAAGVVIFSLVMLAVQDVHRIVMP